MTALTGPGYPISRCSGRCAASGRALDTNERHVAVLVERDGQETLERLDFSTQAWDAGARPKPPLTLFANWRSTVAEPSARRNNFLGNEELFELFEQLGEAREPRRLAFRYVLALMLVRRRVLVYEGSGEGAIRVHAKRPAGEVPPPATIEVADPKIDATILASVMEQLSEIMAIEEPSPASGQSVPHAEGGA